MGSLQTQFVLRPPAKITTVPYDWSGVVWHSELPVYSQYVT
jgi:hypothetical protein